MTALNDGGQAVTLEFVPNEDRITPPEQASFALVMLATTASGDAYTFATAEGHGERSRLSRTASCIEWMARRNRSSSAPGSGLRELIGEH